MGLLVISEVESLPNPILLPVANYFTVGVIPITPPELICSEFSLVGIKAIWIILKLGFFVGLYFHFNLCILTCVSLATTKDTAQTHGPDPLGIEIRNRNLNIWCHMTRRYHYSTQ